MVITIKSYIRDYAISAFIFYSNFGSLREYKDELYKSCVKEVESLNIPFSMMYYSSLVQSKSSEIKDIESVENTLCQLQQIDRFDIIRALEIVYFSIKSDEQLSKRLISCNVTKASLELFTSEKTIYRWLDKAIEIFSIDRGLRFGQKFV